MEVPKSIRERVEKAIDLLLKSDHFLLENNLNERAITHKLAEYLQQGFQGWNVDCEYNRNHDITKTLNGHYEEQVTTADTDARTVFPDIIVHLRDTDENLLVIEVKKSGDPRGRRRDKRKVRAFKKELGYEYGLYIEFQVGQRAATLPSVEWL